MFVLLINDSNSSGHILSKPGPSISENGPSISEKCLDPRKTANFGGKKLFLVSEKNFPVRKWVCHVLFAKKMEKFRQIWPQQPLKHFTAAYRGLPPCTQSQHPINRETGNSNVLAGDCHPVLFINRETHMKKVTNRHRLDYWAPVLPSSPPSSHVMVVIQRKNWGYILHTSDINRN